MAKSRDEKSETILKLVGKRLQSDNQEQSIVPIEWIAPPTDRDVGPDLQEVEITADSVVTVDYENGVRRFVNGDEFCREFKGQFTDDRSAADSAGRLNLPAMLQLPGQIQQQTRSRGWLSDGVSWVLQKIGISKPLAQKTGVEVCGAFEDRKLSESMKKGRSGLYWYSLASGGPQLASVADPDNDQKIEKLKAGDPILLLIHGTASNAETGFQEFWNSTPLGNRIRKELRERYDDRVVAYQHRTLTKSPVDNAIELATALPVGATLHIVSHSRGGLIGELLRRSQRVEKGGDHQWEPAEPFKLSEIELFRERLGDKQAERLTELNDLLKSKRLKIERFVRAGCPARGTTLASGKLDRWLSRVTTGMRMVPGANVAVSMLTDFAQHLIATRTVPELLPGLSAQMPASPLVQMLAESDVTSESDLFVLAGRLRGSSLSSHLSTAAAKLFFGADSDVVVNTGSMYSGSQIAKSEEDPKPPQFFFDAHTSVVHFNYFGIQSTAHAMLDALAGGTRRDKYEVVEGSQILTPDRSAGIKSLHAATTDTMHWQSSLVDKVNGEKPVTIVLPGIMGSHLGIDNERIWVHAGRLLTHGLQKLNTEISNGEVKQDKVEPLAIFDSIYGPLCTALQEAGHDVVPFEYDWRKSVVDAAEVLNTTIKELLTKLGTKHPVRIVAHSMGGLVTREFMKKHPDTWKEFKNVDGANVVLLGSPLLGSFDTLNLLLQQAGIFGAVKSFFATGSSDGLAELVGRFPGFLELLPRFGIQPHNFRKADYFEPNVWRLLKDSNDVTPPNTSALKDAHDKGRNVAEGEWDYDRITFIHGIGEKTPAGLRFSGAKPTLHWTKNGDGVVPWAQPDLSFKSFWIDEPHGTMPLKESAFASIISLLKHGPKDGSHAGLMSRPPGVSQLDLEKLMSEPPGGAPGETLTRGTSGNDDSGTPTELIPYVQGFSDDSSRRIEYLPSTRELELLAVGGTLGGDVRQQERDPIVNVSVAHCDLAFSRWPIAVGHYEGDPILRAERWLDVILDNKLSHRQMLGLYPGRPFTNLVEFSEDERACHEEEYKHCGEEQEGDRKKDEQKNKLKHVGAEAPRTGAIVIGLGRAGKLRGQHLREYVTQAFLEYALMCQDRFGSAEGQLTLRVSSLLIGTGADNLSCIESMTAIMFAVRDANKRLAELSSSGRKVPVIDGLEFVELFDGPAERALYTLVDLKKKAEIQQFCNIDEQLHRREGHRRKRLYRPDPKWWHRVTIRQLQSGALRFVYDTQRAMTPERTQPNQPSLVRDLVQRVISDTGMSEDFNHAANAMFQELIPLAMQQTAGDTSLVLRLDEQTAAIPWEALYDRRSRNTEPLSVKAGLIRQLVTHRFRETPRDTSQLTALIVGDPDTNSEFIQLRGALTEVQSVGDKLTQHGVAVTPSLREHGAEIVSKFHEADYRIMHFAGHGVHNWRDPSKPKLKCDSDRDLVSGMVLGGGIFLTPSMVRKTGVIPELVFINCCHLGRTDKGESEPGPQANLPYNEFAANIAVQFIEIGVRVVIAAGWAINDAAAKTFAEGFYSSILQGVTFGEAVTEARSQTRKNHPACSAWAAFQCYGNPGWRLNVPKSRDHAASEENSYLTREDLLDELYNLTQQASTEMKHFYRGDLKGKLECLEANLGREYRLDSQVQAALGLAWAELAEFSKAIECLTQAHQDSDSDQQLRALDILLEAKYRMASRKRSESDLRCCLKDIDMLLALTTSMDRFIMRGSVLRRLALCELQKSRSKTSRKRAQEHLKEASESCVNVLDEISGTSLMSSQFESLENWDRRLYPQFCKYTIDVLRVILAQEVDGISRPDIDLSKADEWAKEALKSAKEYDASEPRFWVAAWRGGIPLLRLFLYYANETSADEQEAESFVDECIAGYQQAMKRGASPRNRCSIAEFLLWTRNLIEGYADGDDSDLLIELQRISDEVVPASGFTKTELTGQKG